jgi:hypothetical protein
VPIGDSLQRLEVLANPGRPNLPTRRPRLLNRRSRSGQARRGQRKRDEASREATSRGQLLIGTA